MVPDPHASSSIIDHQTTNRRIKDMATDRQLLDKEQSQYSAGGDNLKETYRSQDDSFQNNNKGDNNSNKSGTNLAEMFEDEGTATH